MTADALDTNHRPTLLALAAEVDDLSAVAVGLMLHRWTHPALTPADRDAAWEQLTADVALLDGLRAGMVEPRDIAPGARPSEAYTVAAEVLEQDIGRSLDILTGSDRATSDDSPSPICASTFVGYDCTKTDGHTTVHTNERSKAWWWGDGDSDRDACPECETGRQVVGRPDPDTGDHLARCDAGCGWTA